MNKRVTHCFLCVLSLLMLALVPLELHGNVRTFKNRLGAYRPERHGFVQPHAITPLEKGNRSQHQPALRIKGGPLLWGVVEYTSAWKDLPEEEMPVGVYSLLASSPDHDKPLCVFGQSGPNGGGVFYDGAFHFVNYSVMYESVVSTYTYNYNITTWQQNNYAQYGSDQNVIATDLTYDTTTGNVYGYFYNPLDNSEPMRFGTIAYDEYGCSVKTIAQEDDKDFVVICLAADNAGQLYAISWDGGFYQVDKTTGQRTLLDYTGVRPSSFRQSMTFDRQTGKLYWTAFREDYSSGLYEVNPANGQASLISELPDSMEVSCLYIPEAEALDGAPAAVGDFTVSFAGGQTTGTATFTLPVETYGGDVLAGKLDYTLIVNGASVKAGTADAGARVSVDFSVEEGQNELYVVVANATGNGPTSNKVSRWIGYDEPKAPTDAILSVDTAMRKASLSWTPPTEGMNGGYFDAQSLTYNVVRQPAGVAVAIGQTATTFSETLPEQQLTAYHYEVTAINGTRVSQPAKSNSVAVGDAFDVPFADDFSTDDNYGLYTVVNANGDDRTWGESNHCFAYFYSWTNAADDWLLTPPVKLEAGKEYKFSFDIKGNYDTEKYAVAYGQGIDPTTYTELLPVTELNSSSYITVSKTLTVSADGDYRFGIHALSDKYKGILSVTNIKVDGVSAVTVPDSVTELTVTPAARGALSATVSFKSPSKSLAGESLSSLTKIEVYRNDTALVATIDNPSVGALLECIDGKAGNGMNRYTVYPYNVSGRGRAVTDSTYVGMDVPLAPNDIVLKAHDDGVELS